MRAWPLMTFALISERVMGEAKGRGSTEEFRETGASYYV